MLWILVTAAGLFFLNHPASVHAQSSAELVQNYSQPLGWSSILRLQQYRSQQTPAPILEGSELLSSQITGGKLSLSISGLARAIVENNLTLDSARYTVALADTDVLKARAGEIPSGTEAAPVPRSLGSVSFGGGGGGARTTANTVSVSPRGSFDPSLSLSFSVDANTRPLNNTRLTGGDSVITHTNSLQARYSQAFATGTSFSFGWNVQRQTTTSRNARFNPSLASNYNFSVNQQLFSGFGAAMNRRYQRIAAINRQTADVYFALQLITQLTQAENQYWDLVAAKERILTAEQSLEVSEQLLRDNRRQAEVGTMAPLDVVAAESEVAGRRRDLMVAQTAEQLTELQLKNRLTRSMTADLAEAVIETTDPLPEPQQGDQIPFEEALAVAMKNRPELKQAEGNIQNQQIAVDYTRRRLRPSLSVFGMFSSAGREGSLGSALSQVSRLDFPEYAYGFSLSFPIGNRAAQADHQQALLTRQQSELSLQRTQSQIRLEVRNALIGLTQARAQVAAAKVAVERSRQTLDAEQRKLRAGTSTSYNVIRIQRDLFAAQLAEVQAKVGYAKARVEMDRSMGRLLERRGIDVAQAIAGG